MIVIEGKELTIIIVVVFLIIRGLINLFTPRTVKEKRKQAKEEKKRAKEAQRLAKEEEWKRLLEERKRAEEERQKRLEEERKLAEEKRRRELAEKKRLERWENLFTIVSKYPKALTKSIDWNEQNLREYCQFIADNKYADWQILSSPRLENITSANVAYYPAYNKDGSLSKTKKPTVYIPPILYFFEYCIFDEILYFRINKSLVNSIKRNPIAYQMYQFLMPQTAPADSTPDKVDFAKQERAKMTKTMRVKILDRDHYKCCMCGRGAADGVKLEVDHKIPIAKGGTTTEENLWTLCFDCNRGKSDKVLENVAEA